MKALMTAMVASLVIGGGYVALAQQGGHEQHQGTAATPATQKAPMMESCKAMMADKEKSMAQMKAMDAKLDGLVATMDKATGMAKMSATSALVKELVAQRKGMHAMMGGMDAKMMAHMMQHMQAGTMDKCPMMKDIRDMKGSGGGQTMR